MAKRKRRRPAKPRITASPQRTEPLPSSDTEPVKLSREQQISDLEYPLNDAICMAALLSNAVHQALGQDPTGITGNPYWYHFDAPKVNSLLFAIRHLEHMLEELRSRYYKARVGADV